MLSGRLRTTAWLPPAWSMRQTWWCPSTTWTTFSTRTKMIWRWVETLAHAAVNISLSRVWSGTVLCVCFYWHSCVRAVSPLCPSFADNSQHPLQSLQEDVVCYTDSQAAQVWELFTSEFRAVLFTDILSLKNWLMLKFFFSRPQPGSRRPVNGTDEKFGNKEPKPSTLDPVSCISMYLSSLLVSLIKPVSPFLFPHLVFKQSIPPRSQC